MGRYSKGGSYGHECQYVSDNLYKITWTVDYYYEGSRLRYPRTFTRFTDEVGARMFVHKWGCLIPIELPIGVEEDYGP